MAENVKAVEFFPVGRSAWWTPASSSVSGETVVFVNSTRPNCASSSGKERVVSAPN